jgi:Spy/CpxP family protein refolding chaperone
MQGIAPVLLLALAFVLAGLPKVAFADAAGEDAKPDAPKADRAKGPARGGASTRAEVWWDDPVIVKVLSLTDEQREKMAEHLKTYRENVPRDTRPEAFHETLVQGDWKDARRESEKIAKLAETSVRMRGMLKVDVLSLLTVEQHKMLVERYPRLIYQPWRSAMSGASRR